MCVVSPWNGYYNVVKGFNLNDTFILPKYFF